MCVRTFVCVCVCVCVCVQLSSGKDRPLIKCTSSKTADVLPLSWFLAALQEKARSALKPELPAWCMYGHLFLPCSQLVVGELSPGDCIGEVFLHRSTETHPYTITTATQTKLGSITCSLIRGQCRKKYFFHLCTSKIHYMAELVFSTLSYTTN